MTQPPSTQESLLDHIKYLDPGSEINAQELNATGILAEVVIAEYQLRDTVSHLKKEGFFLESLTAVDFSECFELVYHFNQWKDCNRHVFKVVIPKTQNEAASIHDIYPGANWFEREIFDMFGLKFKDHPEMVRLLLPETSQIHPLLKSFKGELEGTDVEHVKKLIEEDKHGFEVTYPQSHDKYKDVYHINLGPQHPSTHGVLRVILRLNGERVEAANPVIGYIHRNHEKMAEIQDYKGFWPNMGRLDYVGAMSYNFAFAGLIERAMGVEAPERAQYIRVLVTELNRIASHLLWLGTYLLDLGAFTPFFYCFDDRERILDILENVTGERLTYDYFRFGGLERDLPDEIIIPKLDAFIPHFKKRLSEYQKLIGNNIIFQQRTQGVGVISKEVALDYGVTGPNLRASGVNFDLRKQEPYSLYSKLDFEIPTQTNGDAYARYLVRISEMHESLKIAEQIYKQIPKGPFKEAKIPRTVPKGEYYYAVESARGSFGMYLVSDGTLQPYRIKLRTPSFSNLSLLNTIAQDSFMSDLVSILGSIDVVIPEIDR